MLAYYAYDSDSQFSVTDSLHAVTGLLSVDRNYDDITRCSLQQQQQQRQSSSSFIILSARSIS